MAASVLLLFLLLVASIYDISQAMLDWKHVRGSCTAGSALEGNRPLLAPEKFLGWRVHENNS